MYAYNLCYLLLMKRPRDRLGFGGFSEIQNHHFFQHLDWEKLQTREITPPYVPSVDSLLDLRFIDRSLIREDPREGTVEDLTKLAGDDGEGRDGGEKFESPVGAYGYSDEENEEEEMGIYGIELEEGSECDSFAGGDTESPVVPSVTDMTVSEAGAALEVHDQPSDSHDNQDSDALAPSVEDADSGSPIRSDPEQSD